MKLLVEKHYRFFLSLVIIFAFITRIYQVGNIKAYVFDEVYHAVTAKLISHNDPRAFEWWNPPPEPNTAVDWLHPPIAKYTQAASMLVFGETPFGWRFSSVIFGTLVIGMTALLAQELFQDKRVSLLAAGLAVLDGLLLVQSRIAMNDIHVTFFILLTLWTYLQFRKAMHQYHLEAKVRFINQTRVNPLNLGQNLHLQKPLFWLFLTGTSAGLAMASKWSGIFPLVVIWLYEGQSFIRMLINHWHQHLDRRLLKKRAPKNSIPSLGSAFFQANKSRAFASSFLKILRRLLKIGVYLAILPYLIYVMSYLQMYLQGKSLTCEEDFVLQGSCYCMQTSSWWVEGLKSVSPTHAANFEKLEARGGCKQLISHYWELQHQIWWYQTNLKASHAYQSRPIQWFLDLRPVWMYVEYGTNTITNVYSQGNPILFWSGDVAVFASIGYCFFCLYRKFKMKANIALSSPLFTSTGIFPLAFLLISYFMVWLPWQISPRIMFFYHYTPAVPLLCMILGYWLVKAQNCTACIYLGKIQLRLSRVLLWSCLIGIALTFVIFYPNWAGLPVPQSFANSIYFLLPIWK